MIDNNIYCHAICKCIRTTILKITYSRLNVIQFLQDFTYYLFPIFTFLQKYLCKNILSYIYVITRRDGMQEKLIKEKYIHSRIN